MKIILSGALLRFADYNRVVEVHATTFADAITQLHTRHPRLRPVLLDADGAMSSLHRVVLNGQLTTTPDPTTPLADDDEIEFITAIAGG
jgi:molybdopterin synthase sulfur carrier subunit